jgi:hypothetical protein
VTREEIMAEFDVIMRRHKEKKGRSARSPRRPVASLCASGFKGASDDLGLPLILLPRTHRLEREHARSDAGLRHDQAAGRALIERMVRRPDRSDPFHPLLPVPA